MKKIILHSDLNGFYASVECLLNPKIRKKPVAVAGDTERRRGIILAKNEPAKKYNIKTGEPIWMAKQKCPDIVLVPPHYDLYLKYSRLARKIYSDYSDYVESFGLDECWIDASLLGDGEKTADEIRSRVKKELGLTVSIGVSFNKIFAKLGSDYKKPDAITVITKDNFKSIVWPLPAQELLYVGPATQLKLNRYGISTIGDIASSEPQFLKRLLGKNGYMLWIFANGLENSRVSDSSYIPPVKSIGNSTTAPRDLISDTDIKIILYILSESVAARLREQNLKCTSVQLYIRDKNLNSYVRQTKIPIPSNSSNEIFFAAFQLYKKNHNSRIAVRSIGVRAIKLLSDRYQQLSFLPEFEKIQKHEELEKAVDEMRIKYGFYSIRRAVMLTDKKLSDLNPKEEHIIFPESYFK